MKCVVCFNKTCSCKHRSENIPSVVFLKPRAVGKSEVVLIDVKELQKLRDENERLKELNEWDKSRFIPDDNKNWKEYCGIVKANNENLRNENQKLREDNERLVNKLNGWASGTLIETLKIRLQNAEALLLKFVPHKDTIQWEQRELKAKEYFDEKSIVRPLDYKEEIQKRDKLLEQSKSWVEFYYSKIKNSELHTLMDATKKVEQWFKEVEELK